MYPTIVADMPEVMREVVDNLVGSSCYFCMGGFEKCNRCLSNDMEHSQDASFEWCFDILFSHGYKMDESVIKQLVYRNHPLAAHVAKQASDPSKAANHDYTEKTPAPTKLQAKPRSAQQHVHGPNCGHQHHQQEEAHECDACGKANARMRCGQCKKTFYCDKNCQLKHWKDHKKDCVKKA